MVRPHQSQYIRVGKDSALLKNWIARLLLAVDLEDYLVFERIERRVLTSFKVAGLSRENLEDAAFLRSWLDRELADCADVRIDETDVFAVNTRRLMQLLGLDETELAILRFALLLNSCRPLEMVADIHSDGISEIDLCDLLHAVLGEPFDALYGALAPEGRLLKSGLLKCRGERGGTGSLAGWLRVPEILLQQVYRVQANTHGIERLFYLEAPRSTLTRRDFRHLEPRVSLIKDYLKSCYKARDKGVNVLLWGPPGTGKTELARHLAQSLRKHALEINTLDRNGNALRAEARFESYCLCQAITGQSPSALVIYDEVEEILSDSGYADHGFKRAGRIAKGTINSALERNDAPAIWVTNTLHGVDPAYLRRFDLVLQVRMPAASARKRMAMRAFRGMGVDKDLVELISRHDHITPAHLQNASKICARLGIGASEQADSVLRHVLNSHLEAVRARPLKRTTSRDEVDPALDYRPDLVNSDTDLGQLTQCLTSVSSARICLYGPPGTGKTAWGRHLAQLMNCPLQIKRAADILGGFLGDTERNIVAAFDQAMSSGSILMLDEVDSFLQDRSRAHRHWEVAQVNQFLTAMEEFTGILLCTTNLMEHLDPATSRRFDFKVKLDFLTSVQAARLCLDLLNRLGVRASARERCEIRAALAPLSLTPGDFATVNRRHRVLGHTPTVAAVLNDLRAECSFRRDSGAAGIGFTARVG